MALQLHRGEWLLDRRVGLPYLRWRGQKPPRLQSVASRVRKTIRDLPGVDDVWRLRATLEERTIAVTGTIVVADEEIELRAVLSQAGNTSPTISMNLASSGTIL